VTAEKASVRVRRIAIPGSRVAGTGGLASPGDRAAEGPGGPMQHQPPILTALDGEGRQITGEDLLAGIGELLNQRLPDVAPEDPYRPALVALASAAGCRPTAQRQRLEVL
jgi:hypothetical protein